MRKKILLLCVLLVSCAPRAKLVVTGHIYPYNRGDVTVFLSPPETLEYREVGIILSSGKVTHTWDNIIKSMQNEAKRYGANGIILVEREKHRSLRDKLLRYSPRGSYDPDIFDEKSVARKELYGIAIKLKN